MYNLLISIFTSSLVFALLMFFFNIWAAIFPALIVFIAVYIILAKRTFAKFQTVMMNMQLEFRRLSALKDRKLFTLEPAIKILTDAYPLAKWQFFIRGQIDAQIGVIYYTNNKSKQAFPYLQKAFVRHWMAQGMLIAYYYKKKEYDKMEETFNVAIKANKKVPLLYSMYAWILLELNRKEDAKRVITKGINILPESKELKQVLINIQNNKKIKLKSYGDEWYQFRLEKHPREIQAKRPMFKQSKKQRIKRG